MTAIHPRCPCSRATAGELDRVLSRFQSEIDCKVLVFRPAEAGDDWVDTDVVAAFRHMPETTFLNDANDNLGADAIMEFIV